MPTAVYRWARHRENLSLVLLDVGIVVAAWLLALQAGFEADIPQSVERRILLVVAPIVVVQIGLHRAAGLYGPVWRYASINEAVRVFAAVAAGTVAAYGWLSLLIRTTDLELPLITAPPVAALLMLVACGGVRFQSRLFALERQRNRSSKSVRALIVGAGGPGAALAYELMHTASGDDVHLVGFVDDDPRLHRRSVRGIRVLGGTDDLEGLCRRHEVDRILIALPDAAKERTKPIVDRALRTQAQVKVLRPAADPASGMLQHVRDLDISDLLGRQAAPVDSEGIGDVLRDATVLVTGAGGSIGSEISRQVARYGPGRLLLLDRDETLLHEVATDVADAELVLLDLCDRERVKALLEDARPSVIFHAAAVKHVPILERHPVLATRTNVLSTWWLATAAAEAGCRRFVHLSTDKAAHPCSVMGATKRAAEHVVAGVGRHYGLPYAAVRFGNVLGSRGSVVPTFLRQILDGGPVTVTSAEMTRYFMTIPEAVSLVLQAGAIADGGHIFLLDMGEPASILGLARQMIRLAGLRPEHDIGIEITGPRPGERLHERLRDEAEEERPAEHPSISVLRPKLTLDWGELVAAMDDLERASRRGDGAVREALTETLRRCGVDSRLQPPALDATAHLPATVTRGALERAGRGATAGDGARVAAAEANGASLVAGRKGRNGMNGNGANGMNGNGVHGNGTGGAHGNGAGARAGDAPAAERVIDIRALSTAASAGGPSEPGGAAPRGSGRSPLALLSGVVPDSVIPFARPARPPLERVVERLTPSYESGQLTNGRLVRELEEQMAARLGVGHVVAVSSCTSGLLLVVQGVTEGRSGPVVLPSFTFSASAHAVAWNGRSPRFVECDPATFQLDLEHAQASLEDAAAIMATHVFGAPCSPHAVEKLAASAGLPLVFDAAHAIGATSRGRQIGGFGDAEVFSLTPTKPMVAGEGGLIATNDPDLAARLRLGRDYGNPGDYDTRFVGLNARMSEFHAAMALESLAMVDRTLLRRRDLAARYVEGLRDVPGIRTQIVPLDDISTYKDFTVAVDAGEFGLGRDQLVTTLAADGVDTRNYFDPPVHRQQAYRDVPQVELPVTDRVSSTVVSLPLYPDLDGDDIDAVIRVIRLAHEHAGEVAAATRESGDRPRRR